MQVISTAKYTGEVPSEDLNRNDWQKVVKDASNAEFSNNTCFNNCASVNGSDIYHADISNSCTAAKTPSSKNATQGDIHRAVDSIFNDNQRKKLDALVINSSYSNDTMNGSNISRHSRYTTLRDDVDNLNNAFLESDSYISFMKYPLYGSSSHPVNVTSESIFEVEQSILKLSTEGKNNGNIIRKIPIIVVSPLLDDSQPIASKASTNANDSFSYYASANIRNLISKFESRGPVANCIKDVSMDYSNCDTNNNSEILEPIRKLFESSPTVKNLQDQSDYHHSLCEGTPVYELKQSRGRAENVLSKDNSVVEISSDIQILNEKAGLNKCLHAVMSEIKESSCETKTRTPSVFSEPLKNNKSNHKQHTMLIPQLGNNLEVQESMNTFKSGSTLTVVEEYIYTDVDEGVTLIERRGPTLASIAG